MVTEMTDPEPIMKSIVTALSKSQELANVIFSIALFGIKVQFACKATRFPVIKHRLKEKNLTVQIKLKDNSRGRYFTFRGVRLFPRAVFMGVLMSR